MALKLLPCNCAFKQKQKEDHGQKHGVRKLLKLGQGDFVLITDQQSEYVVMEKVAAMAMSYHVQTR